MLIKLRLSFFAACCCVALAAQPVIELNKPLAAPAWALAERSLLDAASDAAEIFSNCYVDERGYFKCVERWGGNDGADDAMENFGGWTLLYALGGDQKVLNLYERAWEGHLQQFTNAKIPSIEMAKDGMYWREFVTAFDWEHTGEALAAFNLYALARPDDASYRERTSDYTHRFNPIAVQSLVNLAMGGNHPGRSGNVLHSRLFYLDPARDRVGLPDKVGALVDRITPDGVRVQLVNLDPENSRDVVLRAGAYGEHQFTSVDGEDADTSEIRVRLAAGSGGSLELGMRLFVNLPTAPSLKARPAV
jgi:hypothetical protein